MRFSAVLGDLIPDNAYTVKLSMFYDTSESMASPFSRLFYTLPVTVPGPIPAPLTTETFPDPPAADGKKKKNRRRRRKNARPWRR